MAPRKAAAKPKATTTDQKSPTLKLDIEKGPISGQILEFNPGSVIRIGRVVRGNTLPIKEAGISSKHCVIKLDDDDSQRHWTITDLDSSNGTFLNSQPLTPQQPFVLSNDDEIKIGEMTVIRVLIVSESVEIEKRVTRGRGKNLGVIPEDKVDVEIEKETSVVVDEKVSVRRTRNSKKAAENVSVSVRRTRSSVKEKEELEVIEGKGKNKGARGKKNVQAEKAVEEKEELVVIEGKSKNEGGRGKKNVQAEKAVEEKEELVVIEGKSKNEDGRGKTNVQAEKAAVEDKEELVVIEGNSKSEGGRGKANVQAEKAAVEEELNVIEGVETGKEGECGASGVEKGEMGTRKGQLLVDLETMTLGEWFDFLEDYLPKQIVDATEEVISDMKEKAKRVHEYKMQQMNAKK